LEEAPEAFADLLVRKEFAAFERSFAAFHSLDEAVFFGKVTCHNILHNFAGIAALPRGQLFEAGLQIVIKVNFHKLQRYVKGSCEATREPYASVRKCGRLYFQGLVVP
jgi:hypothetical protein